MNQNVRNMLTEVQVEAPGGRLYATGIPITPRHVLTARHVLEAKGNILVRQPYVEREKRFRAEHVWQSATLDVAVLKVEIERFRYFASFLARMPREHEDWHADTFALAGVDSETRVVRNVPFSGSVVAPPLSGEATLPLQVSSVPHVQGDWRGASGGPVYIQGALAAILCDVPTKLEGRVHAIPVRAFAEDAAFLQATGLHAARREIAALERRAALCLGRAPQAAAALAAELGLETTDPVAIVEGSLRMTLSEWLRACSNAQYDLGVVDKGDQVEALVEVVSLLLPALQATQLAPLPRPDMAGVLRLDASTATLAEILIAACSGVATRFDLGVPDSPRGEGCLVDDVAELGLLVDDVEAKVAVARDQLWHLLPSQLRAGVPESKKDERIRSHLAIMQDPLSRERCIYYYLCTKGNSKSEAVGAQLGRLFPELLVASLDSELTTDEHAVAYYLAHLLVKAARPRGRKESAQ